jgi:hypothetical protein
MFVVKLGAKKLKTRGGWDEERKKTTCAVVVLLLYLANADLLLVE